MEKPGILTARPKTKEQFNALKAVFKALKVDFTISNKEKDSPYNSEFVEKIRKGEKDLEDGKGISMTFKELDAL